MAHKVRPDRQLYEDREGTIWSLEGGKLYALSLSGKRFPQASLFETVSESYGPLVRVTETRILEKRVDTIEVVLHQNNLM